MIMHRTRRISFSTLQCLLLEFLSDDYIVTPIYEQNMDKLCLNS